MRGAPPSVTLGRPLVLPCGAVLPNRLAKASMSERLGDADQHPTEGLARLYHTWAMGGAGLLVTGNVMIDRAHLERPANVAVEDERGLSALRRWAEAAHTGGVSTWVQLNHPGRRAPRTLSPVPVAPSALPYAPGSGLYAAPRALSPDEVPAIVDRFARAAAIVERAGFTGIQIHAAHGYLVSQFLSSLTNHREDAWGGPLANRLRLLVAILRAVRGRVSRGFAVGVKLCSIDLQDDRLTTAEQGEILDTLAAEGVDLLEISGGHHERPAPSGEGEESASREVYFLAFAAEVRRRTRLPLMLTGGFRTAAGMAAAVESGDTDMVGLGRPLAGEPDLPARILAGTARATLVDRRRTGIPSFDAILDARYLESMQRMSRGQAPIAQRSRPAIIAAGLRDQALRALRGKLGLA